MTGAQPSGTAGSGGPVELVEPFAWMSKGEMQGRYKFTLKSPTSEAITGTLLLLAGILFSVLLFTRGAGGAVALAVLLLVVFGGLGIFLLIMAAARARWVRAYRALHGHKPY